MSRAHPMILPLTDDGLGADAMAVFGARQAVDRPVILGPARLVLWVARAVGPAVVVVPGPGIEPGALAPLRRRGARVIHLDVGGGPYRDDPRRWGRRLQSSAVATSLTAGDHLGTWGRWQRRELARARPDRGDRIVATGHPRFELFTRPWRRVYEDQVRRLKQRLGNLVVICPDLLGANQEPPPSLGGVWTTSSEQPRWPEVVAWSRQNQRLSDLARLIHELRRQRPDVHLVLSPDPDEDEQLYQLLLQGLDGVQMISRQHLAPFVVAARVVIHGGGEVATWAHLAEVDALFFRPPPDQDQRCRIARCFGGICGDHQEAIERIGGALDGEGLRALQDPPLIDAQAGDLLSNLHEPGFEALDDVVQKLGEELDEPRQRLELARRLLAGVGSAIPRWPGGAAMQQRLDQILPSVQVLLGASIPHQRLGPVAILGPGTDHSP